ncbi:MAG TPA: cytochrome P450 [Polyangiaceae bacterium]
MNRAAPRPRAPGLFTVLDLGRDQLRRPVHYFDRLGDTFGVTLLGTRMLATRDPAVFEDVLVRQHKLFSKDRITQKLSILLGQGLLTSEGPAWRKHRRLIQPHLQPAELARYLPVFRDEAERLLETWPVHGTVELHAAMAQTSMRIALRTLFGADAKGVDDFESSMRAVMMFFTGVAGTAVPLPLWLPTPTNRRFLRARAHLNDALHQILVRARDRGPTTSVLQNLLSAQDGGELSEQQLVDEGLTLLLAGHETSALALTYTLALLATDPERQKAVHEELGNQPLDTLDSLRRSSGLSRALKESMRLYPEAWALGREALEDCEVAGMDVRRGTQIFLYQWAAHRHPRYFDAPDSFFPERWTPEFEASLPRVLYAPFGAGPRVCVGSHFAWAEVLCVLGALLRRTRFEAPPPFAPRFIPSITLRPRDPVHARILRI